ncbi:MAG: flagellar hook-associated protein FlgK [Lachnospiraceae bacterium]|nr:flagellar hook-associated protein FlgK [Lachnospiraceae bacterium]
MGSTFTGLNIGLSGLNLYQTAINTTSHNIANADTEGYSRQQAIYQAANALRVNARYGMAGQGVQLECVQQIRDSYYDVKYRDSNSRLGEYKVENEKLLELENYFNEITSESGFNAIYTQFNNSLVELSSDPSNETKRTQVLSNASSFTTLINELATNLNISQSSVNDEIAIKISEINSISEQIFTLNKEITNIEIRGLKANDLRDQRNLLFDQLSAIANIEVKEEAIYTKDGMKTDATTCSVRINGHLLVDNTSCNTLKVVPRDEKVNQTDAEGLYDVYFVAQDGTLGTEFDLNSSSLRGELKGLMNIRDGNNAKGFDGNITALETDAAGNVTSATIKSSESFTISDLTLPATGKVQLAGTEFYYDSFDAEYDADGNILSVKFNNLQVKNENGVLEPGDGAGFVNVGSPAEVSQDVNYKGIPYYMSQLSEFARAFSEKLNAIHTSGVDLNFDEGLDLFGTEDADGNFYAFKDLLSAANAAFEGGATSYTFSSTSDASYYQITCNNWQINEEIYYDVDKFVVSTEEELNQGVEQHSILDKMITTCTDTKLFNKGTANQFLENLIAEMSIDCQSAEDFEIYQTDITNAIENQRLSISGVDANEEGLELVKLQRGYNLNSKVISVINEILSKLINETGV